MNDIISGYIYPGQKLVERELIEKYGVSKTPVREALNKLAENDIVKYELNKGFSVARFSRKDVQEIYELREISEGLVARNIAENKGALIFKEKDILKNIELSEKCLIENDIQKYSVLDMDFHKLLANICINEKLRNLLGKLYYQSRLLSNTSLYLPDRGISISLKEHKNILNAIANKDAVMSEKEARNHVNNVKIEVLKWIKF